MRRHFLQFENHNFCQFRHFRQLYNVESFPFMSRLLLSLPSFSTSIFRSIQKNTKNLSFFWNFFYQPTMKIMFLKESRQRLIIDCRIFELENSLPSAQHIHLHCNTLLLNIVCCTVRIIHLGFHSFRMTGAHRNMDCVTNVCVYLKNIAIDNAENKKLMLLPRFFWLFINSTLFARNKTKSFN